jgi:hypothetical protein
MAGRAKGYAVSTTSVVVAAPAPTRQQLTFSCGNAGGTGSVVLKDEDDATVSNGFPVTQSGSHLVVFGLAATHRWSAIRLAAADCVVGVIEVFSDSLHEDPAPESVGS